MVNQQPPVLLFIGRDDYSKAQAIKKISASLFDGSSRELNYKTFDGDDTEARDILAYLSTIPFLASKRLVVVKNSEKLSAEDTARLVSYIKNPVKSTCLIFDAADDSLVEKYPQISRHVVLRRFGLNLSEGQFESQAKEVLASMGGKSISPDAAKTLRELCGNDLGSLSQELQKLSSFVGSRSRIETEDVEEVTGKSISASAFDLTDAIEERDLKKALSIISELLLSGKKHYEIIGLLCWQMKKLFKGRVLLERAMPDPQIANELRIGRRYHDRFFRYIKSSALAQIESRMRVLLETDLDIKKSRYDPAVALEFAVIKLCLGASR